LIHVRNKGARHTFIFTRVGAAWFNVEGSEKVGLQDPRIMAISFENDLSAKRDHEPDGTDCYAPPFLGSDDGSEVMDRCVTSTVQIMASSHAFFCHFMKKQNNARYLLGSKNNLEKRLNLEDAVRKELHSTAERTFVYIISD
jgi:hypothetical protein